jgi:hypothetical protein
MTDLSEYTIFLSHSSKDGDFVTRLSQEIEKEFIGEKVFASIRPDAIKSGVPWQPTIIDHLDQVKAFIILITVSAENSVWVGFELGYFWKQATGKHIHALYHPTAKIPSPLNTLQSKSITDFGQLETFFRGLGESLGKQYSGQAKLAELVEQAKRITTPPPERSLRNFERFLEQSDWDEGDVEETRIWICADDALFQIVVDFGSDEADEFIEPWTRKFPDAESGKAYPVKLNIGGVTIKRLFFISVDGGRYFVPRPKIKGLDANGKQEFVWTKDSLEFKLSKFISKFYHIHPTIEEFATHCGIEIE